MKQVIINLLSNAVKYNIENGSINISAQSLDNDRVQVRIDDTGKGLSRAEQERLFVPFDRLGAEETSVDGTGIGLVITQKLLRLMGGEIGYQKLPEGGSRVWFKVNLSFKEKVSEINDNAQAITNKKQSGDEKIKVLYFEDNPANLRLVERFFYRQPEYVMFSATTPTQGLAMLDVEKPDIVLLDINLPEMSGYEVIREIKRHPEFANLPVIAISANAMDSHITRAFEEGFNEYLTKPINFEELLSLIQQYT